MARLGDFLRVWMTVAVVVAPGVFAGIPSYFKIVTPAPNSPWLVGQSNAINWVSANEGVTQFDVEIARLKTDGLIYVARNVSTTWNALNVMLDSVPAGEDYYLLFLDSTHGNMYSLSDRFSILAAGSSPSSGSVATANPTASTVTIKGGPNPTSHFATTFAGANSATRLLGMQAGWTSRVVLASSLVLGAVLGSVVAVC